MKTCRRFSGPSKCEPGEATLVANWAVPSSKQPLLTNRGDADGWKGCEDTRRSSRPSSCKAGEATLVANWLSERQDANEDENQLLSSLGYKKIYTIRAREKLSLKGESTYARMYFLKRFVYV